MCHTGNLDLRLTFHDARFFLPHRITVVIQSVQHELPIELGNHIAFVHVGSRVNQLLEDERKITP
jgi:hypothetical protein